jgi:predicted transcriptional regulator
VPPRRTAALDERVLQVLRAGQQMTVTEIGKALNLDRAPVTSALNRLRVQGLVRLAAYEHHHRTWGEGTPGVWEAVPPE